MTTSKDKKNCVISSGNYKGNLILLDILKLTIIKFVKSDLIQGRG